MPLSISNNSKNTLTITNENKTGQSVTIDEMVMTIDEANVPIDYPGLPITKEAKNTLTITNESKN